MSLRSPTEVKADLLRRAAEIGFDDCRIARADDPRHAGEFREWLEAGSAADMDWIARGAEKRCDPQKVLAGARSVVTLAMNYWQGDGDRESQTAAPARGRIARYAWGDDYHDVLEKKLRALDGFLTAAGGRQKFYVDTGPVLERDFAAEAGIGWHGKSTMLLNRQFGTWFFLAEIFTTLELPSDPPQVARCGSCTRCIDACPTGAITAPHQLDARRCISYLTIELKGSIPLEFRPLIGDRIFGCDDCLDACPWNRFAQVSRESAFAARPGGRADAVARFPRARRRAIPRALSRLADQADQASRLLAQCLCRARQCRDARRSAGVAQSGAGPRAADRGARGMGDRANRARPECPQRHAVLPAPGITE